MGYQCYIICICNTFLEGVVADGIEFSALSGCTVPWFDPGIHTYDTHVGFHPCQEGGARPSGVGGLVILVVSLK